jgi:hypothetical protein
MAGANPIFTPEEIQHETWKPAIGYEAFYEVSTLGRVRSLRRKHLLKPQPHKDGYRTVSLCVDGRSKTVGIHKLVAAAFIGPRPDGHEVNHEDGDKANNRYRNLEYKTHLENMIHARVSGLWRKPKLNEFAVVLILELFALGYRPVRVARMLGMDPTTIRDIKRGVTWRAVSRPR